MASRDNYCSLHFVLAPHLASGHMIPMVDMGRLLARHGVTVTILTTPLNAAKFTSTIDTDAKSGLHIQIIQLRLPTAEVGLPEGCESMDMLPTLGHLHNFLLAMSMLQQPAEQLFSKLEPKLSCIIADKYHSWTSDTALKFNVPRLVFDGTSCFSLLTTHNILASGVHETLSDTEPFVVPGLPDRIVLTKSQLPNSVVAVNDSARRKSRDAELSAYGVVVNTFQELEPDYVREFRKVRGDKVWCIGPVSSCNKDRADQANRGGNASITEDQCLNWLDLQDANSVIYVCFGSLSRLGSAQLIELGSGLEASNRPFIWVIRQKPQLKQLEEWLVDENFEEKVKGRGLLIRGWAPQVLILSHPSVGGFLTHCGWNSTLESLSAGVPMICWPQFAEQFYNEKLIVQILGVGVKIGVEVSVGYWGDKEEEYEMLIKREKVKMAVEELMEGDKVRERAKELRKMAISALEIGGSSYRNIELLIHDIKLHNVGDRVTE